jgi:hypothetical protein
MQSVPCAALFRMKFLDSMDFVDVGRNQICLQIVFDIHCKNLLRGCADWVLLVAFRAVGELDWMDLITGNELEME